MARKINLKPYFPHIYRTIPAGVLLVLSLLLLIYASVTIWDFFLLKEREKNITAQLNEQRDHWENVIGKYPDYRDGYYQLAILEYNLGNKEKAKNYLEKAFEIDANFEEGRELEQMLQRNSKYQEPNNK